MGAVGYRPAERTVAEFLRHQQARIREEALVSLYSMFESGAQKYLVGALDDADPRVCQTALGLLAACRSADPNFTALVYDLVSLDAAATTSEEGLILSAVHAIRDLGNVPLASGVDSESAVVDALRDCMGGRLLSRGGGRAGRSPGIQAALCEALAAIGSRRAKVVLEQASREGSPSLRESAVTALDEIKRRSTQEAS